MAKKIRNSAHKPKIERAIKSIQDHYSKIISTTNFEIRDNCIGWPQYSPGIYANWVYAKEYQHLVDTRQYSFLVSDGSFFQFYFDWEEELVKAKLAYYPVPAKLEGSIDALLEIADSSGAESLLELYYHAEEWADKGLEFVNTSSIRLDYDSNQTSHSKCHIQFGGINELRIHSEVLLNPFTFFCWVMGQVGPDEFAELAQLTSVRNEAVFHQKDAQLVEPAIDGVFVSQVGANKAKLFNLARIMGDK